MSSVTCRCTACDRTVRLELEPGSGARACPACQQTITRDLSAFGGQRLSGCLVCPSRELFIRKDFPQRLGVTIVVAGFAASCITWYFHAVVATFAILFATALLDVVLYLVMGNVVECYRCHAQYRGIPEVSGHHAFDLEVHERYRQQAARLQQATAPSSADRDESEQVSSTY